MKELGSQEREEFIKSVAELKKLFELNGWSFFRNNFLCRAYEARIPVVGSSEVYHVIMRLGKSGGVRDMSFYVGNFFLISRKDSDPFVTCKSMLMSVAQNPKAFVDFAEECFRTELRKQMKDPVDFTLPLAGAMEYYKSPTPAQMDKIMTAMENGERNREKK